MLRAARAVKLRGQREMRGGEPQPLATDVMHMSEYRCDGSRVAAKRLRSPRVGIEMLEDQLVHAVIDDVALEQRLAKFRVRQSSGTSHGLFSISFGGIEVSAESRLKRAEGAACISTAQAMVFPPVKCTSGLAPAALLG